MQYNTDDIKNLYLQSFPKGRAFNFKNTEIAALFYQGIAEVDARYLQTTQDIQDSQFTDSGNFDVDDARKLEKRYGILINEALSLATRKQAIEDRMSYPNGVLARQSASYIEYRLQQAGFDVYVHENRFGVTTNEISRAGTARAGVARPGVASDLVVYNPEDYSYEEKIINRIDVAKDTVDVLSSSRSGVARAGNSRAVSASTAYTNIELRFTFFIGGETFPDFANVDADRKREFRHLILKLKPAQMHGYLMINYI